MPYTLPVLKSLLRLSLVIALIASAIAWSPAYAASSSTIGSFEARAIGDDQALATWERPPGARRFTVQVSEGRSFTTTTRTLTTRKDEHFMDIDALEPSTTYVARARAGSGAWSRARVFTTTGPRDDFGVMTYNLLCADYCVEGKRHNRQTFPWLQRRARVVNDLKASTNVDIIGLQEAGGYVATGWNCRTRRGSCSTPKKLAPDGKDHAYDRFCTRKQCPTRVPGGRFGGAPRQIDDIMRHLPEFDITQIAGDPNREESGYSYLRIMWRTSTFELARAGSLIDIDGRRYEKKVRWHRKAYWAILTDRSTGQSYFVVTAHPVSNGGVSRAEGYPRHASGSTVRAAGARRLVSEIRRLNTGGLPVILTGDFNTATSRDGSLSVLAKAGYADTRTAAGSSRRTNPGVATGNGFDPTRISARGNRTPVDRIFTLPGRDGAGLATSWWWLQAPVRGRLIDNCRRNARTAPPAAGCWGSDHFPVIAQLRPGRA